MFYASYLARDDCRRRSWW